MVNGLTPTSFSGVGLSLSIVNQSRMSLPVAPADYIYAQFEHVSGTPAPEGVQGVTISKLKILDTLIDQLQQIKKNPEFFSTLSASTDPISSLVSQIRQAMTAHAAMPYLPNPAAPSGAVLNLSL